MKDEKKKRPFPVYILMLLMLFQAASGLYGGFSLVSEPSGGMLQMPLSILDGTPFSNYLVPGIILLLLLGVVPLMVLPALWRPVKWAWDGALGVSVALISWIGVQILMVGYAPAPPLQLIYGSLGVIMLILVLLPPVRRFYL